jgi:hypothetical protein
MGRDETESWTELRRALAVDEARVAFYGRLREAFTRLEELRLRRGVSERDYDAAQVLDAAAGEEETEELARLARAVAALGGRLELRAVFPEETVRLSLEPAPGTTGLDA